MHPFPSLLSFYKVVITQALVLCSCFFLIALLWVEGKFKKGEKGVILGVRHGVLSDCDIQ